MTGFIVLYRWTVEEDRQHEFRQRWREATLNYRDNAGALGSSLTRTAEGDFIAIALWSSEEARAAAFRAAEPAEPWPGVVHSEQTNLFVDDDLWLVSPFRDTQTQD